MSKMDWGWGVVVSLAIVYFSIIIVAALKGVNAPPDTPPPCCGETINDLHDRIDRLQAEVRHQTDQKVKASMGRQHDRERIMELEQELSACTAHVLYGEPGSLE